MTDRELAKAFRAFARLIVRMGETSEPSMFTFPGRDGLPAMGNDHINVQLMVSGKFGAGDELFKLIRAAAARGE